MPQELLAYHPEERTRHGKALDALTDQQYLFVMELAELPVAADTPQRAAVAAGYSAGTAGLLLRNPRIVAAIREAAGAKIQTAIVDSIKVAQEIMESPTHKDRLKAAKWLAELGGFVVQSEQKITVEHQNATPAEERAELQKLLAMMGPDARRLAQAVKTEIIDAEYEVVQPAGMTTEGDTNALAPDGEPW